MTDMDSMQTAISTLILTVFRFNGRISEWGDRLCAPLGLSTTRWQVLGAIDIATRPLTAPQIAYRMGLTRQGVQKQLNALMDAGLVVQQGNPLHERSHLYALTASGKDTKAKVMQIYADQLEHVTAGLSKQQIAESEVLLNTMVRTIENLLRGTRAE